MSDRLAELLRQRALLREHLAWLEKEIAAAGGGTTRAAQSAPAAAAAQASAPTALPSPPSPIAAVTVISASPSRPPLDADALIQRYGYDPKSSSADVKRGCWIAFAAAFAVLGILVALAWMLLRSS